jgi:glycosyltransferase involved in cell wall biosynthesis
MPPHVHIVTRLHGIGGAETLSSDLCQALNRHGTPTRLWSESPGPFVSHFKGTSINPYNGILPKGGTLLLVGTYFGIDPWIDYVRPERLLLLCVNSDPRQLYAMLATLERASLPRVELIYVSTRLRDTLQLPGQVCPEFVDLDRFTPRAEPKQDVFSIGRLSRDVPEKHHPQDPSLYRMLGGQGIRSRLMGGTCLQSALGDEPTVDLLGINSEKPEDFLRTLDVFYYRTHPTLHESSGRVIVEAMACGLPIVAHKSGGYTDWVKPGENGYIFSTQEEALQLLLLLRNDAGLREKLARGARQSAIRIAGQPAQLTFLNGLSGLSA